MACFLQQPFEVIGAAYDVQIDLTGERAPERLPALLYMVSERRRELGIRLALGATNSDLLRLVLGYRLMISVPGITVGIISASALSSLLKGLLWNVKPTDPTTFVGVSIILCASALFAAFLPAWNASRTDPMQTLRGD